MPKAAVVVFARTPQPGRVKTRLIPPLTPRQALAVHVACLEATTALVASLPRAIHKYVYFTGSRPRARAQVRHLGLPRTLSVRAQARGNLGARLEQMFSELFAAGYERVVVIGSDSPTLPRTRLLKALAALRRVDVVIGPSEDGGYYLLGCRALAPQQKDRRLETQISRNIPWGSAQTFARTIGRLRRLRATGQLRYRVLPRWYDVDRPADLLRLRRELARSHRRHLLRLTELLSTAAPRRNWLGDSPRDSRLGQGENWNYSYVSQPPPSRRSS